MTCQDIQDLLSASLDGELTPDEQARLDEHLNTCPACRALYEELSGLHAAELWETEVPPELTGRILKALPAQRSGKVVYWKRWGAMAAAIALVALAAWRLPLRPPTDPGVNADTSDTTGAASMDQAADAAEDAAPEDAEEPMLTAAMEETQPAADAAPPAAYGSAKMNRSSKMAAPGGGDTQTGGAEVQDAADTPAQAPALPPVSSSSVDDAPAAPFSAPVPDADVALDNGQDAGVETQTGTVGTAFAPTSRAAKVWEEGAVDETAPMNANEVPEPLPPMEENEVTMSAQPFENLAEDIRDFSSYRYVLTLSRADGLDDYPHQLQPSGEMWYLLPLEAAEALPQTLAETDPGYTLRTTGEDLTADSPYVLVVVSPAS